MEKTLKEKLQELPLERQLKIKNRFNELKKLIIENVKSLQK